MRSDIAEALSALGLPPEALAPLRLTGYRLVLDRILDTFTVYGAPGRDLLWLWEGFKGESHAVHVPDATGYRWPERLIAADQRVWFVTEDCGGKKRDGHYWLFEGRVRTIVAVPGELFAFEYYLVAKDYSWLLCETHHNILVAVGSSVVERLRRLEGVQQRNTAPPSEK